MIKGLLLSGGIDSIALAFWLKPHYAFTIDYGQKAATAEMKASAEVCKILNIIHIPISVDCGFLGSGDLANKVPTNHAPSSEWWPFRNQLLITLAGMKALDLGVNELLLGSVKNDSFHLDGTLPFYTHINSLMEMQEGNIKVNVPGIHHSTIELVKLSKVPIEILGWAHSCHKSNTPCGNCNGCNKYIYTMQSLGFD